METKDYRIEKINYNFEQDIIEITVFDTFTGTKHNYKTRNKNIVQFQYKRFDLREFLTKLVKANAESNIK